MGLHNRPHRIWSMFEEGSDAEPGSARRKPEDRDRGSDHRGRESSLMMLTCRDVIGRRGRGDTGYATSCACVPRKDTGHWAEDDAGKVRIGRSGAWGSFCAVESLLTCRVSPRVSDGV